MFEVGKTDVSLMLDKLSIIDTIVGAPAAEQEWIDIEKLALKAMIRIECGELFCKFKLSLSPNL